MLSENRHSETRKAGRVSGGSRITGYLLTWAALAACALGYLTVAAARPDLLAMILPVADRGYDEATYSQSGSDLRDEVSTIRKWVNELQHEVAAAKSAIEGQTTESRVLAQRLTVAEQRIATTAQAPQPASRPETTASAASPPIPAAPAAPATGAAFEKTIAAAIDAPPAPRPRDPPPAAATAAAPPQAEPQRVVDRGAPSVKILNPAQSTSITTGSVAGPSKAPPPAPKFGAAKVTAPPPPPLERGIEIGNAESLDGLRSQWSQLSSRNGTVLGNLAPRYLIAADGSQSPFKLMAGPFKSTNEAVSACRALRAGGVACKVGRYIGNAF